MHPSQLSGDGAWLSAGLDSWRNGDRVMHGLLGLRCCGRSCILLRKYEADSPTPCHNELMMNQSRIPVCFAPIVRHFTSASCERSSACRMRLAVIYQLLIHDAARKALQQSAQTRPPLLNCIAASWPDTPPKTDPASSRTGSMESVARVC